MSTVRNESNNTQTFVFSTKEQMPATKFKSNVWQILPAVVGSLIGLPFGIMLGWPSPTYPKLLGTSSPIPISIDQSAMIAGFLMIGNSLGTPFSSWSFLGTKYGMVLGTFFMLIGWIVMYFAYNIYFLLASRILIGLGFGYAVGQLKIYIKELCTPNLAITLTKLITFYAFFGVIVAFVLGYFVTFTDFSLVAIATTCIIWFVLFFLPHTPKEYLIYGKTRHARRILRYLKPTANVEHEIQNLNIAISSEPKRLSFFQMLRDSEMRKKFAVVGLLTFFMQFSGAPATIVYSQIIFSASFTPYPEFCAMFYAVLFFASNFIGVFCFKNVNRKFCLLASSISVTFVLILNVIVFYMNFNKNYWRFSTLVALSLYIFFHSIGLAVTPFVLAQEYFPEKARRVVTHFQIMQHSALALIITKIFQVLYDKFDLYVPFCLFTCVSFLSTLFISVFVPFKSRDDDVATLRVKLPMYT